MAQFDLHRSRGALARSTPYLVILQADAAATPASVVVAPMRPISKSMPLVKHLHVEVQLDGTSYLVMPEELISMPRDALGSRVGSLASLRFAFTAALDFLFTGF
ncbi:MAG TPA: CcdB family protein [Nevskiaceae bacterium]|nr:CcdB family protein [Nevskiaceae bacterium]